MKERTRKWFYTVCGLLLMTAAIRGDIVSTLPFTLTNNTVADANQVMANFNAIRNGVNLNAATAGANTNITSLVGLTSPLDYISGGSSAYVSGTSGGSANAQTVASTVPSGFTLTSGKRVTFIAGFSNSAATTLNVAATGAVNVFKTSTTGPIALAGGEIIAGNVVSVTYDGTRYQIADTSTGVPVGTVADYAGLTAPAGYLFATGTTVSRSTYAALLAVIAYATPANTTNTSAVVTGITSTTTLAVGMPVGGTNVTCGATIVSVDSATQVTISAAASATGATTLTFAPYGVGDCSTNFNLPDLRGRLALGRDDMSAAANRVTFAGTACRGTTLGIGCGTQSITLSTGQLPVTTVNSTNPATVNFAGQTGYGVGGSLTGSGTATNVSHSHDLGTAAFGDITYGGTGTTVSVLKATGGTTTTSSVTPANLAVTVAINGGGPLDVSASGGIGVVAVSGSFGSGNPFSPLNPLQVVNKIIKY